MVSDKNTRKKFLKLYLYAHYAGVYASLIEFPLACLFLDKNLVLGKPSKYGSRW
jgi:hypothetical protein